MINTPESGPEATEERVDDIVASGPHGAIVVAGIATAVVVAMWLLFYFLVFLPRGAIQ
ncbi:hypothetical protein [Rhizobium sp. HT1-10]|uniref:hypothetical protein n=1 Tax=Rhizobium sp. HT1-10 TaxID=3111638 RepID=UPI003C2A5A44